jgi:aminoglycoside phosphotransferase (APT) family kinase protein
VRTWQLEGGVSAQVTAFEIERPDGGSEKLIVRRHGAGDRGRNPRIAADEFRLLQLLESAGLPVPKPRLLDADAELFSVPYLVVEYVEGEPAPADGADVGLQLATVLAEIHRVDAADLSFLPELTEPQPTRNRQVLLHGDFWPGNTLWRAGRLVAVVDWEDAAVGDPLADLANARFELLWAYGLGAMEDFTRRYESLAGAVDFTDLPHWDLWADRRLVGRASEWELDSTTQAALQAAHETFVAQALENLD